MKIGIILILFFFAATVAEPLDNSVLYQAASDELSRSIKKLRIEKQTKPYYISYRIEDTYTLDIEARFGGLMYSGEDHNREVYVDVRVGSYDLDNSNFICKTRSMNLIESEHTYLPVDDDYEAIRQALWIVTDGTYKKALERLSRKVATLQNQPQKDTVPDFARVQVASIVEPKATLSIDRHYWEETIVHLSTILKEFPDIQESDVSFSAQTQVRYILDTEGSQSRTAQTYSFIEVAVKAQSNDGDPLEDRIGFLGHDPNHLPDIESISQRIRAMAETLSFQVVLKQEEEYSGPVLFVGQAAAELFFQVLGKGISDPKTPLFENEMLAQSATSDMGGLTKRLGRRVMSKFLSTVDDPTLTEWDGIPLVGHYTVDDQSIPAQRVAVVTDGKLTSVLMSRAPTKRALMTNGHGRYCKEDYGARVVSMIGNLIITSQEQYSITDLTAQLLQICKDYDIPYGIVVTRLSPTKPLTLEERYMRYFSAASGMSERNLLSTPVTAYRIDVESGTSTLIRGLDFSDLTSRVLRDIVATGDEDFVYNFLYRDEHSNAYPMSVVAPAILVEEIDMEGADAKPKKLPIVHHPYFGSAHQNMDQKK